MLKNKFILLNNYLESKIIIVFVVILLSPIFLIIGGNFIYIFILLCFIFGIFAIIKSMIDSNIIKFNKSIYTIPDLNDTLVVIKSFYYDGSILKFNMPSMHSKPNTIFIEKGTELKIEYISNQKYDWVLITDYDYSYTKLHLPYFSSKKYWVTKKELRENKLNKILKWK